MLVPVSSLPDFQQESTANTLEIKGNVATWFYSGTPFRTFTMDESITLGVLTSFNGIVSVALVCNDLVYVCDQSGNTGRMGLQFTPESACACENGVVFMYNRKIYIMSDTDSFVGLVAPSSTTSIDRNDKLLYFGETDISVAVIQNKSQIKLLHVKKINNRTTQRPKRTSSLLFPQRRQSSLANQLHHDMRIMSGASDDSILEKLQIATFNDIELQKEALISLVTTIEFPSPPSSLKIIAQRFENQQEVYLYDQESQQLHILIYSNDSRTPILKQNRQVKGIAKLTGFQIGKTTYPVVVLLGTDDRLYLHSSFFQLEDLPLDIKYPCCSLSSSGNDNSFVADSTRYFLIDDNNFGLVGKCFEILAHLLEPTATMYWLMVYQGIHQLMPDEPSWSVFFITTIACLSYVEDFEDPNNGPISTWVHAVHHVKTTYPGISFDHITSTIIIFFHMLREDYLLGAHSDGNEDRLGLLLSFLTCHAGWDGWALYYGYSADLEYLLAAAPKGVKFIVPAERVYSVVPNIYATLISLIAPPYIQYPQLRFLKHIFFQSLVCQSLFECLSNPDVTMEQMVELLNQLHLTPEIIGNFAEGVRVCIMEIISSLQLQKSLGGGDIEQFKLLGRRDFEATASLEWEPPTRKDGDSSLNLKNDARSVDRYLSLVFDKDRRFRQTCQLLNFNMIHECHLAQPGDLSDHEWLELQNSVQWTFVVRNFSRAFGICAMYFSSEAPFISERSVLPDVECKMLMTETNSLVVFDTSRIPEKMMIWGYFHMGISIGLRISRDSENVTGSWIVYNKPEAESICLRHAGFLLGLGINGHLKKLEEWHVYNYMGGKDPVISIALLIGLAASDLGSMDSKLTKVLSVHIPALLPQGANDLNVRPDVRVAAIVGIGLLYFGTCNRRMTEVFMSEISSVDNQKDELYRYACGMLLGLMNIHQSAEKGGELVDRQLVEKLEHMSTFVSDDIHKNSALHMSSNGAIFALMLMYLQTNNQSVASKLAIPSSMVLASYGRPDFFFSRAMAYHLIMWGDISNSVEWIKAQIAPRLKPTDKVLNIEKLPYLNILGGIATAVCLRYAGTQNLETLDAALAIIDELLEWTDVPLNEAGFDISESESRPELLISLANVSFVLSSLSMAAATVVVSSGNLDLLRRLRILHTRGISSLPLNAIYNLNVGISQGLGMLFLGGSEYSFDQSPKSIGFLAISVGMLASAGKYMINWQFLRYFWAFSAKRQSVILKDVTTNEPIKAEISVTCGDTLRKMEAPALLPCDARIVEFTHPEYLPLALELDKDQLTTRSFEKTRTIYVQKRPSIPLPDTLEKVLLKDYNDQEVAKSISSAVRHLNIMSQFPDRRASYMWNLRLLFTFTDFWTGSSDGLKFIPGREIDVLKLNVWRVKQNRSS